MIEHEEEAVALRTLGESFLDRRGRVRGDRSFKERVRRYASARLESGVSLEGVGRELCIPKASVARWLKAGEPKESLLRRVRVPVRVSSAARGYVVHGPGGLRVECATAKEVADLWTCLS